MRETEKATNGRLTALLRLLLMVTILVLGVGMSLAQSQPATAQAIRPGMANPLNRPSNTRMRGLTYAERKAAAKRNSKRRAAAARFRAGRTTNQSGVTR